MSHLVEERLDVVLAEQTRPAMAHAGKVRHEDDHRQLKATGPSATRSAHDPQQMLGGCVGRQLRTRAELYIQVRVILVDAPRAPHGVMRGTGRLSLARVQVTVNRANHAATVSASLPFSCTAGVSASCDVFDSMSRDDACSDEDMKKKLV